MESTLDFVETKSQAMAKLDEKFMLSPRNICVSLTANFVMPYKVSEVANLEDIEGTCCIPE